MPAQHHPSRREAETTLHDASWHTGRTLALRDIQGDTVLVSPFYQPWQERQGRVAVLIVQHGRYVGDICWVAAWIDADDQVILSSRFLSDAPLLSHLGFLPENPWWSVADEKTAARIRAAVPAYVTVPR